MTYPLPYTNNGNIRNMDIENKIPKKLSLERMFSMLDEKERRSRNIYLHHGLGVTVNMQNFFNPILLTNGPFLIEDYRFGLIKKGNLHTIINLKERFVNSGFLVFVTPGTIVDPISIEKTEIDGMALSPDILRLALHDNLPELLNGHIKDGLLEISETDTLLFDRLYHTLSLLVNAHPDNQEAHLGMAATIIHSFNRVFSLNEATVGSKSTTTSQTIFDRFIELVNQHCLQQHQLNFYAERMCITERYLGTVVRQTSGATAKEWIDKAIVTAAKVMLRHSNKQVVQISDSLNFPTPSFFCKYFKRLTGQTPQEYRNKISPRQ